MSNLKRKANGDDGPGDHQRPKFSMQLGGGVAHLECWYFFTKGNCVWGDGCRYAHHRTGLRARRPRRDAYGTTAGRNASSANPTYTQWQGVDEPIVRGTLVTVPVGPPSLPLPPASAFTSFPRGDPFPPPAASSSIASPALAPTVFSPSLMQGHQEQQQSSPSDDRRRIRRAQVNWDHYNQQRRNTSSPAAASPDFPTASSHPDRIFASGPDTTGNMSRAPGPSSSSPSRLAVANNTQQHAYSSSQSTTYKTPSASASTTYPRSAAVLPQQHAFSSTLSTNGLGRIPGQPIIPPGSPSVTLTTPPAAAVPTQQPAFLSTLSTFPTHPSSSPGSHVRFSIPAHGYRAFPASPGPAPSSPLPTIPNMQLEHARRAVEQIDNALQWYAGAQEVTAGVGALSAALGGPVQMRIDGEVNEIMVRLSIMARELREMRRALIRVVETLEVQEGVLGEEEEEQQDVLGLLERELSEGVSWGPAPARGSGGGAGAGARAGEGSDKAFV